MAIDFDSASEDVVLNLNLIAEQKELIDEYASYAGMDAESFVLEAVFETITEIQSAAQAYSAACQGHGDYTPQEFIDLCGLDKELLDNVSAKFHEEGIY